MSSWIQDLRFAVRMIRKSPLQSAAVIVTLGLCIGASAALFSVVQGLLLAPFPYPEHEQLAWMQQGFPRMDIRNARFSLSEVEDLDAFGQVFTEVSATRTQSVNLTEVDEPERVRAIEFSPGFFELLAGEPQIGRLPDEQESRGASDIVLMSHRLWENRYGEDPSILDRTLEIDGRSYTVLGVMPPRFLYGGADLWYPIEPAEYTEDRSERDYVPLARLRSGLDVEAAESQLTALAQRWENDYGSQYPEYEGMSFNVAPIAESVVGRVRPALLLLQGAVALVLLIACVNVANLLLVKATSREKELAVRAALGSGRLRLGRQLLTESLLLACLGGLLGLGLTILGVRALVGLIPARFVPIEAEISVSPEVMVFALGMSLAAGFLFGLAPALAALRRQPVEALKEGGRRSGGGVRGRRVRNALVMVEVALALIVLVGAGLALRSIHELESVDPGFDPEHLLSLRIALPEDEFAEDERALTFFETLERRVEALPGVESAAVTSRRPLRRIDIEDLRIEGRAPDEDGGRANAIYKVVDPGYFETMDIPLVRGRLLDERDETGVGAVVINEAMAERFWPESDPLASRVQLGPPEQEGPWVPVVGIVGDVRQFGLDAEARQEFYVLHRQRPDRDMALMVRTEGEPLEWVDPVRRVVTELHPTLPVYDVLTMEQRVEESVAAYRLTMVLLGIFASVALILAVLGIYATIAYSVGQRTQELGVRLALGARMKELFRLVLKEGLWVAGGGLLLGMLGALASAQLLSSLVYGISTRDPGILIVVAAFLAAVAGLATYLPARRAMRVDPVEALRYE